MLQFLDFGLYHATAVRARPEFLGSHTKLWTPIYQISGLGFRLGPQASPHQRRECVLLLNMPLQTVPTSQMPKFCWHFQTPELQTHHQTTGAHLASMLPSKSLHILRCKIPTVWEGAAPCQEGTDIFRAFMHLPSADKIRADNPLREHLVAGDFSKHNPKASWPQGPRKELDYENAGWRNQTRTVFSPLVQRFAVAAEDGWWNDCLKQVSLQVQLDFMRVSTKLVWSTLVCFNGFFKLLFLEDVALEMDYPKSTCHILA